LAFWLLLANNKNEIITSSTKSFFYRDGQPDNRDNCPQIVNADQADADDDDVGDECDYDIDDDGWRNDDDVCPWVKTQYCAM